MIRLECAIQNLDNQWVGSLSCHTAIIILLTHEHITIVTPVVRPRVFDKPVVLAINSSITNQQHSL